MADHANRINEAYHSSSGTLIFVLHTWIVDLPTSICSKIYKRYHIGVRKMYCTSTWYNLYCTFCTYFFFSFQSIQNSFEVSLLACIQDRVVTWNAPHHFSSSRKLFSISTFYLLIFFIFCLYLLFIYLFFFVHLYCSLSHLFLLFISFSSLCKSNLTIIYCST